MTGASRGAGAGIAHALGAHGANFYVISRSEKSGDSTSAGTIDETAQRVNTAGGHGIAVRVHHGDDDQVRALFDRIADEHELIPGTIDDLSAFAQRIDVPALPQIVVSHAQFETIPHSPTATAGQDAHYCKRCCATKD